jgi:hypothetical protein
MIDIVAPNTGGIHGHELALAVLANHALAQVLDANLQAAATGRTFLDEESGIWHD